uniref:Fumarylacetoacetase-like C-terminal domain-containing protein n=1 Tax=Zea mays TaxID=4577 RepID=A0A804M7W3_MAIZE
MPAAAAAQRLLAASTKIIGVGRNYIAHSKELGNPVPKEPVLFLKPTSSFLHAGVATAAVEIPEPLESLHHEVAANGWSGSGPGLRLARRLCTYDERDDRALEEEVEKKFGWILKIIFLGTAGLVGYQFFPYMGDNLLQQSISLLRVKDPLFKRMGASRLARFAVDDQRRMKVVEIGGAQELLNVLEGAKDDKTRKETLKALAALSKSGATWSFVQQ